ncbi:hypothetical protein HMPREF3214_01202 [Alloscardovia omnicolens]|nr:hypothetical protein HMPREF3214_01202 [Alloscardovia omnicolens]
MCIRHSSSRSLIVYIQYALVTPATYFTHTSAKRHSFPYIEYASGFSGSLRMSWYAPCLWCFSLYV